MSKGILFDVDGVLARFTCGAILAHGRSQESGPYYPSWDHHKTWGLTDEAFYAPMNREFWAGLGRWEDGFKLLERVIELAGKDSILFLTAPVQTPGCEEGKRAWAAEHLTPLGFDPFADVLIGGAKHKLAHRDVLLVDDSDSNIKKFHDAGGRTWRVPRPWNANRDLCERSTGLFDADHERAVFTDFWRGLE